jgi:hypothetical protein
MLWQVALLNLTTRRICFVPHWTCLPVFKVATYCSQKSLSWSSSAERKGTKEGVLQIAVRNHNVQKKLDPTSPAGSRQEAEMWSLSTFLRKKVFRTLGALYQIPSDKIRGIHKRMVRFQKLTRNLFLTLHGHNLHRQQRQLSKFLMR